MLAPIGAMLLFTAWLALLFAGLAAGGAVHLLLLAAVGVFPWRALRGRVREDLRVSDETAPTGRFC